jgi:filamentous hemagglutinin
MGGRGRWDRTGYGIRFPNDDSQIKHIFRKRKNHFNDTIENRRRLLETAKSHVNYKGKDAWGNNWYAKTLGDGTEIWVETRDGIVRNGGINSVPNDWSYLGV